MSTSNYIAEIDGLRALAVLAVLLFHAFPTLFVGGYIGVDAFFVISGFVISRKYMHALIEQNISLRSFYIKRVRRLAPAYTLVLGCSVVASFFLLEPKLLNNYAWSLASQPFYGQNFIFWLGGNYFDKASTKPLLHTWSLAVEEQFYILFGLIIFIFRRNRNRFCKMMFSGLSIIFILSLLLGYFISNSSPKTSFFLLPTRVWEFALGIFAYLITQKLLPYNNERKRWEIIAYLICTSVLIFSILGFNHTDHFPGTQSIVTCTAVCFLLILFDTSSKDFFLFSNKLVRYLGNISYSLYLWHWPIIVYMIFFLKRDLFWSESAGALFLSFILSFFTYKYVEQPIRNFLLLSSTSQLLKGVAISSMVFFSIGIWIYYTKGAIFRYPDPEHALFAAAQEKSPYRCGKLFRLLNPTKEICKINEVKQEGCILIIGDSHADQLDEMISELGEQTSIPVYLTVRNCDFNQLGKTKNCSISVFNEILQEAQEAGVKQIIATSFW
ncbi:MAG: acyltransferase, partial [Candidatus Electrothrix sp. AR3]|nr:acyltransferase [Candidatus Electrothrix sp. AR3]